MTARRSAVAAAACLVLVATAGAGPAEAAKTRASIEDVRVGSRAAPVVLKVETGRDADLRLRVNGEPARDVFYFFGPGTRVGHVSASQGLRPGSNRLLVRATGPAGRAATDTANVRLSAADLLADAGEDTESAVGSVAPVGASAPGDAKGLRYRWRITEMPAGADARLREPRSAQPDFHARTRGTYVLRLRVRRSGRPGASHDSVSVPVGSDPPIGAPITTINSSGKIEIGGGQYPAADVAQDRLAWAVVSRTTRDVVESGTVGRDDAGMATLWSQASKYATGANFRGYLMVVSGRMGLPDAQLAAFGRLAKRLGSPALSEEDFVALRSGHPFSIIGMPGGDTGAATVRIPPGGYSPQVPGAITGNLQQNLAVTAAGANLYEYVSPEYPIFDTRAPEGDSEAENTIAFNGTRYADILPSGATAGLHVLVFESMTLRPIHQTVLATNGADGSDRSRQAEVARQLKTMFDNPGGALVFVQTIGNPKGAGPEWTGVVDQLARLGANRNLVYALDGTTEYAIVGRVAATAPPLEASTAFDKTPYVHPTYPPARLIGSVARGRDSKFVPTVGSSPTSDNPGGVVNTDLVRLAYQNATAWPELAPGAPQAERYAAARYIWTNLGFCGDPGKCGNAQVVDRNFYWNNWRTNWTQSQNDLARITWPGAGSGFTEPTFNAIKEQLGIELGQVSRVQTYFENLKAPFDKGATRGYVDLQDIGKQVYDSVQRPAGDDGTSAWVLKLVSYAVKLGEFSPPPGSAAAAGTSAIFGLASFLSEPGGAPILGDEVKARAQQLATAMLDRYALAKQQITGVGRIIVSDYGKLTAAAAQVNSAWRLPTEEVAAAQVEGGSRRWFYEALVPVAYPWLIRGETNARGMDCEIRTGTGQRREGWPNQPDSAQMSAVVGYDESGNPITNVFWFARGIGGAMSPPESLGHSVFAPPNNPTEPRGLGIEKLGFFTPEMFGGNVAHAIRGQRWCRVSYLPRGW